MCSEYVFTLCNLFPAENQSSRSSNFLDYYSNVTEDNVEVDEDDESSAEEYQEGEWVWIPKGYNAECYQPATYQTAQSRQGILSLVNPQQLVSHNNESMY